VTRSRSLATQLEIVHDELRAGRFPGITLRHDTWSGHVVTAYDLERVGGALRVYVYDNNSPFRSTAETGGLLQRGLHSRLEIGTRGVIEVDPGRTRWSFQMNDGTTWSGGGSEFWTLPLSAVPEDPTLITGSSILNFDDYAFGQFVSPGGAARSAGPPTGAEWMPVFDDHAIPGAAGTWTTRADSGPRTHTVRGTADGTYSEVVTARGFEAAMQDVPTGAGVTDDFTVDPATRTLTFSGNRSRAVRMTMSARLASGRTRSATMQTMTGAVGGERARLRSDGSLEFDHDGPLAVVKLELADSAPVGGPASVVAGDVRLGAGDRLIAAQPDRGARVRLEIRRPNGAVEVQKLRPPVDRADVRVRIERTLVRHTSTGADVMMRTRLSHVPEHAVGGVRLMLKTGRRILAKPPVPVRSVHDGVRTDRWRLPPRIGIGQYRLEGHVTVIGLNRARATGSDSRSSLIRLER